MADQKISQLSEETLPAATDVLPIVQDPGGTPVTKKITVQNLLNGFTDGWMPADTFTYASQDANTTQATVTVTGNVVSKYRIGTRIKLTDVTTVYALVSIIPTYSSPNTTITLWLQPGFTLSGGAITSPYYSYEHMPENFPDIDTMSKHYYKASSDFIQTSPTANTWYDLAYLNASKIYVPSGKWFVKYNMNFGCNHNGVSADIQVFLDFATSAPGTPPNTLSNFGSLIEFRSNTGTGNDTQMVQLNKYRLLNNTGAPTQYTFWALTNATGVTSIGIYGSDIDANLDVNNECSLVPTFY